VRNWIHQTEETAEKLTSFGQNDIENRQEFNRENQKTSRKPQEPASN